MRNILVVWTIGNFDVSTDHYEMCDDMEDAENLYNKVLDYDDLLGASIVGVIESTDYEPYGFINDSEKQLEEFLKSREDQRIFLSLKGQGDITNFGDGMAVNICTVEIGYNSYYIFGGIREEFYDRMVFLYDYNDKGLPAESKDGNEDVVLTTIEEARDYLLDEEFCTTGYMEGIIEELFEIRDRGNTFHLIRKEDNTGYILDEFNNEDGDPISVQEFNFEEYNY